VRAKLERHGGRSRQTMSKRRKVARARERGVCELERLRAELVITCYENGDQDSTRVTKYFVPPCMIHKLTGIR